MIDWQNGRQKQSGQNYSELLMKELHTVTDIQSQSISKWLLRYPP